MIPSRAPAPPTGRRPASSPAPGAPGAPSSGPALAAAPPRWAFWKGLLAGAVVEVPALVGAQWLLARLGLGATEVDLMTRTRATVAFCGFAAALTAGGIGRLAAQASVEGDGGRARAIRVAARVHAIAFVGLLLIALIPHGHLPALAWPALAVPALGLLVGAAVGAALGAVCGGPAPVFVGDVVALARRPSDALLALLDPAELARLGAALRDRTSQVFDGMFDPAAPPPGDHPAPRADADDATGEAGRADAPTRAEGSDRAP